MVGVLVRKVIHLSLCKINDSVLRKLFTKGLGIDFFCTVLFMLIFYCPTHNILQEIMATRDFKPCHCYCWYK